jgi:signal transduction histidine kinase/CheY-like chemotaxis protein
MQKSAGSKQRGISFQSARSKVIAGFTLAGIALLLFWMGIRFVSGVALHNVEELSKPNDKLVLVHALFQEFTRVDQLQRHIAVKERQGRREKLSALSDTLQTRIEALKGFYKEADNQYRHLDSIQQVIERRDRLFWNFIQQRDKLMSGKALVVQTQAITELIALSEPHVDTNMQITTHRQVATTITPPDTIVKVIAFERQGGFFGRFFGKKKPVTIEEDYTKGEPEVVIEETTDSIVNVMALSQKDTILPLLEEQFQGMIRDQQEQAARMAWAELGFLKANNLLANEILNLLYQIEEEELRSIETNQIALAELIHRSFSMFNWLLIGILLCLACLIFLILTDFSRSRRFRAQLVEAKEEAERLSRVKERFLSNMSHEIRTPLQSIIGYAELIQKQERPFEFDKQAIHQSARHLLQIVNEILDYNRLVSGRFQLDSLPFDPMEVLEEVGAAMKVQAERKGLEFTARLDIEPGNLLLGDAFRLRQILYNLLGNAIKFTDKGSVSLSANMQSNEAFCNFQFRVEDTGIGISSEGMEHIFNQFEQAPGLDRERYGGTGLGLSIVKALVEIQGGEMQVASRPGAGSQFSIRLQYPKASPVAPVSERPPAVAGTAGHAGVVYIVDDDAFTQRLCRRMLSARRINTAVFSSAAGMLESAVINSWDIVLTDINLPGMSGYQLLQELRKRTPETAVVAMTALALPEEQQTMRQAGFDEIIIKPFIENELIRIIDHFTRPAAVQPPPAEAAAPLLPPAFAEVDDLQELFVEVNGKDLAALSEAIEANDADAAAGLLHRLAGRNGQFGLTAWYQVLRRLENQLKADADLQAHREEIEDICGEIAGAIAVLETVKG